MNVGLAEAPVQEQVVDDLEPACQVGEAWRGWRTNRDPRDAWLLCWVLVPLAILTVLREKLAIYLLPVMPPIAILIARFWSQLLAQGEYTARLGIRMSWVFLGATGLGIAAILASRLVRAGTTVTSGPAW